MPGVGYYLFTHFFSQLLLNVCPIREEVRGLKHGCHIIYDINNGSVKDRQLAITVVAVNLKDVLLLDPILQGNFNCDFQTVHGSAHDWWES
jgi:hypothetical protein